MKYATDIIAEIKEREPIENVMYDDDDERWENYMRGENMLDSELRVMACKCIEDGYNAFKDTHELGAYVLGVIGMMQETMYNEHNKTQKGEE